MRHTRGDRGHKSLLHKHDPELTAALGKAYAAGFDDRAVAEALNLAPSTIDRWTRLGKEAVSGPLRSFWIVRQQGIAAFVIREAQKRIRSE
jgi:hypothetical protein